MYDFHIAGDIFNPIGILCNTYEALAKYNKFPENLFDNTLHLELPNIENVSLIKGYLGLYFVILTFKCLNQVLSCPR